MKTYRTNRAVQITGGMVHLSEDQARRRAGFLRKTEKPGVYEVVKSTQFKAGEEFGFDGDVPKSSNEDMVEVSGKKSGSDADKKAAAEKAAAEKAAADKAAAEKAAADQAAADEAARRGGQQ